MRAFQVRWRLNPNKTQTEVLTSNLRQWVISLRWNQMELGFRSLQYQLGTHILLSLLRKSKPLQESCC